MGKIADWLLGKSGAGILNGIISGAASAYSTWQDARNVDKSLSAQSKENQLNREYNFNLAKYQNAENLAQWSRENAYNSPSAQKQRLEAAGLNADLMYGGSGVMNTAASSPQMTSGAPSSPMDWSSLANRPNAGDAVTNFLDQQYKQALIDNVNADTKNKGHEGSILASDAAFRDAYNSGVLKTQNVEIDVKNKSIELTDQQIKESQATIRQLDASCSLMSQQMTEIQNRMNNDNARLALEKTFNEANIKKLAASTKLDLASANNISSQLEKILRKYDDEHAISEKHVINLGHEGDILEFEKGIVKFKSEVLFNKKRDLTASQQYIRFSEELMKAFVSSL